MSIRKEHINSIKMIDIIPALSGLIGKVALASSFAFMWAHEFSIGAPHFVLENVRLEIFIGSLIALLSAFLLKSVSPAGTLAPLIVLIPIMAKSGVHPFVLSILVGLFGMIGVKTGLLGKLIKLAGTVSKASLAIAFGMSGIVLSLQKLLHFFREHFLLLVLILLLLSVAYFVLIKRQKSWLIILIAAAVSILLSFIPGYGITPAVHFGLPNMNPFYWWTELWGIGFGLDVLTIFRTLPFALFVVFIWSIDTVSIQTIIYAEEKEATEVLKTEESFLVASARNMIGGICGGAQTSALWRSFLIPLYHIGRPIRPAAILLGLLGIAVSVTAVSISYLSYTPMVWTVLLFGVFLPFAIVGVKNFIKIEGFKYKICVAVLSVTGIFITPILAGISGIMIDSIGQRKK